MSDHSITHISELDCYLVGGAVRDQLLQIEDSDRDWVVVGATPELMLSLGFRPVGKNFPVYLHPQSNEEYALARTEQKTGKGYKGFQVDTSSTVSLEDDLYRRDLTVNAMALDLKNNLIDPYGGKEDLENGLLRHVSSHFVEDPLRVLRVARFSARFHSKGFIVHDSTLDLMREISDSDELDHLTTERVWQEVESALGDRHPSVFFRTLKYCGALGKLLPELECLFDNSSSSSSVANKLDLAVGIAEEKLIRFCMLAYLIRHCDSSSTDADNADPIASLCKRLKTPRLYRMTAAQVARYADRVMSVGNASAAETVEMVLSLNGIRNQKYFEQFLRVCTVVLTVANGGKDKVEHAISLLRDCRETMKRTDVKHLVKKFTGNELRNKVRSTYADRVSDVLERYSVTRKQR